MKPNVLNLRIRFVLALCVCSIIAQAPATFAADHLDGEVATADPAADITDVYAWMQNSDKINLVLDVFPLANEASRFSDAVQYVFRVNSSSSYGGSAQKNKLVCTFSVSQAVSCELDGDPLFTAVDASNPLGVTTNNGAVRIFTGLRNDPFFFDLDNFKKVRSTVVQAAPSLDFDSAGCPMLDEATKSVLVSSLTGNGGIPGIHSPAVDFFAPLNVLSIIIQADRSLFGPGPLYAVSASTHRPSV